MPAWAACRKDERAVVTLLQHGAEVNTLDIQFSTPVSHAADRDSAVCVRLLLEAGAKPDLSAEFGHRVGNPVNLAGRNASDPMVLKTLLDFGANVDSTGVDGMTALIHSARKNNVEFAVLLLDHFADINAISSAGQTPLTTAIIYNSHEVLRLLLDRWFEYPLCPRIEGPHLLNMVALYADVQTMLILADADHLMTMYGESHKTGDFVERLKIRPDATEKLIQAFDDLLSIMKQSSESRCSKHSTNDLMESGLL